MTNSNLNTNNNSKSMKKFKFIEFGFGIYERSSKDLLLNVKFDLHLKIMKIC